MFGPMLSRFPLARSQCARAVAVLWVCLAPFLCNVRAAVPPVQTVFVIVLENNNWAAIKGSSSAPYLNNVLLPQASYCEQH